MPMLAGRQRTILIVLASAVVAGVGFFVFGALRQSRLNSLFAGICEDTAETRSGFYAGVVYDLKGYAPGQADNAPAGASPRVPGMLDKRKSDADYDRAVEGMHYEWALDASTGATKVSRLASPSVYRARWVPRSLTLTYPPDNAVFPPNLCAPTVEWSDPRNNLWQVTLSIPSRQAQGAEATPDRSLEWTALSETCAWQAPDDVWAQVTARAGNAPVRVVVKGVERSGLWGKTARAVHRSQVVRFTISADPADEAIVYRLVDPPFVNLKTPNIYVRDIREKREKLLLDARRTYCFNCHSFSSKSGTRGNLALQVRYLGPISREPRSYLSLYDVDRGTGRRIILPFEIQLSTFMGWSADGTKLAVAANQKMAGFYPIVYETQSVGMFSDIAVVDTASGTATLVPGAADPKALETYPCWTPDGKSIIYSSAPTGKHYTLTQFDLKIVPYNDGRGGTPRDLPGAAGNGRSNYFARFSPDGKWFTWVQSDYESLIKASSDIWIMPGTLDGPPRKLECNVPYAADSWHSWSSNSRWLVFATKRDDGVFARLYLTHIDEAGRASPAVRLPIEDPLVRMSFNIPEFVAHVPPIREGRLFDGINIKAEDLRLGPRSFETHEAGAR